MSASEAVVLVTGATGKVGQQFIGRFLADERWSGARVRALLTLQFSARVNALSGAVCRCLRLEAGTASARSLLNVHICSTRMADNAANHIDSEI